MQKTDKENIITRLYHKLRHGYTSKNTFTDTLLASEKLTDYEFSELFGAISRFSIRQHKHCGYVCRLRCDIVPDVELPRSSRQRSPTTPLKEQVQFSTPYEPHVDPSYPEYEDHTPLIEEREEFIYRTPNLKRNTTIRVKKHPSLTRVQCLNPFEAYHEKEYREICNNNKYAQIEESMIFCIICESPITDMPELAHERHIFIQNSNSYIFSSTYIFGTSDLDPINVGKKYSKRSDYFSHPNIKSIIIRICEVQGNRYKLEIIRNLHTKKDFGTERISYTNTIGFPLSYPLKEGVHMEYKQSLYKTLVPLNFNIQALPDIFNLGVKEAMTNVREAAATVKENMSYTGLKKLFTDLGDNISNEASYTIQVLISSICIGYTVDYLISGESSSLRRASLMSGALIIWRSPDIYDAVTKLLRKNDNTTPEAFNFMELTDSVYTLINSWIPISKTSFLKIYNTVASYDRFTGGMASIYVTILNIIQKVSEWISGHGIIPDQMYLSTNNGDVLDLIKYMDKIFNELKIGILPHNNNTFIMFKDLKNDLTKLMLLTKDSTVNSILSKRLSTVEDVLDNLRIKQDGVDNMRVEPVGVMLTGCPKTLKSTFARIMAQSITTSIHFRNSMNRYWDGYHGEEACVFDDAMQARDSVGEADSEAANYISIINQIPYHLHMANLRDKDSSYFTSKYVICTTNHAVLKSQAIHSEEALRRRFSPFSFKVIPVDEYRLPDGGFDFDKFTQIEGVWQIEAKHCILAEVSAFTGVLTGKRFTILEVINNIKLAYEMNIRVHEHGLKIVRDIRSQMVPDMLSDLKDDLQDEVTQIEMETMPVAEEELELTTKLEKSKIVEYMYSITDQAYAKKTIALALAKKVIKDGYECLRGFVKQPKEFIIQFVKYSGVLVMRAPGVAGEAFLNFSKKFYKGSKYSNILHICTAVTPLLLLAKMYLIVSPALSDPQSAGYNIPLKKAKPGNVPLLSKPGLTDPQADQTAIEMITKIFKNNSYFMIVDGKKIGTMTFVKDRFAIMNAHYMHMFNSWVEENDSLKNLPIRFKPCQTRHDDSEDFVFTLRTVYMGILNCSEIEDNDYIMVKFPSVRSHRDITHHFKSASEWKDSYNSSCRLGASFVGNDVHFNKVFNECKRTYNHTSNWVKPGQVKNIEHAYWMIANSANGDCGDLYFELNSSTQTKKIIGIHQGGNGTQSICVPVDRDMIQRYLLENKAVNDQTINEATHPQCEDPLQKQFLVIREDKKIPKSNKSLLMKSALFGKIAEVITFPALLGPVVSKGVLQHPGNNALMRYNKKQHVNVDATCLINLIHSEKDYYRNNRRSHDPPRIFTFKESILGLEDDENFSSINRKSSAGYPHVFDRVKRGKADFFGSGNEFDLETERCAQLQESIVLAIDKMKNHERLEFIFIDCIKDETLPMKKIKEFRSRIFSACNIEMLLLYRMYFGDFVRDFTKNRINNSSAIGVNPYSADWDIMARKLLNMDTGVNAGDFSGFDTSQSHQLLESIYWIIEDFYTNATEEESDIRKILWMEMYNSRHLWEGFIYSWDGCLGSGNPLTAMVNSMMHRLLMKLAFRDSINPESDLLFWTFDKNVSLMILGDDGVFTVSKEYNHKFNEYVAGDYLRTYGMKYTAEDKDAIRDGVIRSIDEVSFLKRSWRYDDISGRYVAPMKLDALLNQLNWTKKHDSKQITIDKCNHVCRELSLHGKETFNKYVPRINEQMLEYLNLGLENTSYIACLTDCLNLTHDIGRTFVQSSMPEFHENMTNYIQCSDTDYLPLDRDNCNMQYQELDSVESQSLRPTSIQMDGPSQSTGSADFVNLDDPETVVTETTDHFYKPVDLKADFTGVKDVDIRRFLEKPTRLVSSSFSTSDTARVGISYDYLNDIRLDPVKTEKIKGIYTIRSTLVLTIQVNANPFQAGRYILAWIPTGGADKNNGLSLAHSSSIVQMMQLPHVEIDLACDTSATLEIPFKSAYNSTVTDALFGGQTNPGFCMLYAYAPLRAVAGSLNANYSIWAHHKDIELGTVGYIQAGDILAKEQKGGVISDTLSAAAGLGQQLARIPLLTSIASPTAWALEAIADGARMLGFSKPNVVSAPQRVVRALQPYMGTSDGHDASEPLSLFKDNHVSIAPELFGTEVDEMSIDFLKSKPNYLGTFEWTTANTVGQTLSQFNVTPYKSLLFMTDSTVPIINMGTLGLLSSMFSAWKGGLIYHFKIVKTKYHSGRIQISFRPFNAPISTPGTTTTSETEYMYRNIIDIREMNEFKIHIPFVAIKPWLSCIDEDGCSGRIDVKVIDPLVAPDTVSSDITIKVEFCGASDFAVAAPRQMRYVPIVPTVIQSGIVGVSELECQFSQTKIGGDSHKTNTTQSEESSMGESVKSLRPLLKRGGLMSYQETVNNSTAVSLILPFHNYCYEIIGSTQVGPDLTVTQDYYSLFCSIYALSRGGVRLRFINNTGSSTGCFLVSNNNISGNAGNLNIPHSFITETKERSLLESSNVGNSTFQGSNSNGSVFIPQQTYTYSRIASDSFLSSNQNTIYQNQSEPLAQVRFRSLSGVTEARHMVWRSGADDCTFGTFISIPPMVLMTDQV